MEVPSLPIEFWGHNGTFIYGRRTGNCSPSQEPVRFVHALRDASATIDGPLLCIRVGWNLRPVTITAQHIALQAENLANHPEGLPIWRMREPSDCVVICGESEVAALGIKGFAIASSDSPVILIRVLRNETVCGLAFIHAGVRNLFPNDNGVPKPDTKGIVEQAVTALCKGLSMGPNNGSEYSFECTPVAGVGRCCYGVGKQGESPLYDALKAKYPERDIRRLHTSFGICADGRPRAGQVSVDTTELAEIVLRAEMFAWSLSSHVLKAANACTGCATAENRERLFFSHAMGDGDSRNLVVMPT